MLTQEQAMEDAFQVFLNHCRFVEAREQKDIRPSLRPPPVPEDQIRRGWEAMCREAGRRKEESRRRAGGEP